MDKGILVIIIGIISMYIMITKGNYAILLISYEIINIGYITYIIEISTYKEESINILVLYVLVLSISSIYNGYLIGIYIKVNINL